MKTRIILIIFLFMQIVLYSQRMDSYWMMGYGNQSTDSIWWGANLIFDTTGIKQMQTQHRILNIQETLAVIADKRQKLLFYSNGNLIANSKNDTLGRLTRIDGVIAAGNAATIFQQSIILPAPMDTNIFLLFHVPLANVNDNDPNFKGVNLYKTVLDKRLNNGDGGVSALNDTVVLDTFAMQGLTAIQHANGRDWWLIMPDFYEDEYNTWLVTGNTITQFKHKITSFPHAHSGASQSFFSKDGTKYLRYDYNSSNKIFLMDFDRCAGVFSNPRMIPVNANLSGGMALSANGKILYVVEGAYFLYQFDISATNIDSTKSLVATDNGQGGMFSYFSYGYLAPDNRIYFVDNTNTLTVINHPNVWGLGCDVQQHSIVLPTINGNTVPNYPNFYLGPLVGSGCDTLTSIKEEGIWNKESVQVYPNPAKEVITFSLSSFKKEATCYFYNAFGQCVKAIGLKQEKTEIKIEDLPEGVYFYEVVSANTKHYGKFVIQR